MKSTIPSFVLALGLATFSFSNSTSAQTQLYQWVDENGVKHFSQQPPPEAPDLQPTDINGAPVISGGEPQPFISRGSLSNSPEESEDGTTAQTASVESETSRKDPEKCANARESIRTLTDSARVRLLDEETGEYNFIDDTKRQEQLDLWKEQLQVYC